MDPENPFVIIPASSGYRIVRACDDGDGEPELFSEPVLAWRVYLVDQVSDLVAPISDEGFAIHESPETCCAIERPDGSVYNMSGEIWTSRQAFKEWALGRFRKERAIRTRAARPEEA